MHSAACLPASALCLLLLLLVLCVYFEYTWAPPNSAPALPAVATCHVIIATAQHGDTSCSAVRGQRQSRQRLPPACLPSIPSTLNDICRSESVNSDDGQITDSPQHPDLPSTSPSCLTTPRIWRELNKQRKRARGRAPTCAESATLKTALRKMGVKSKTRSPNSHGRRRFSTAAWRPSRAGRVLRAAAVPGSVRDEFGNVPRWELEQTRWRALGNAASLCMLSLCPYPGIGAVATGRDSQAVGIGADTKADKDARRQQRLQGGCFD
ncbi:uncharacterized protein SCHCODRAFT_02732484 [Schizophyllum commune H4-8]|uniref:Uncharacterized protein n=1 Tax=Schizophyllum commune (strain H4-8 / FGSC 9210) TaxID=578458 RepID=D8Q5K3_SCHCM|nr:uncharacterized protein SCHCODRAFT_02732484 [Schizophyllum commune H4-8]KAI5892148.1 hypothetical protein SCHCODRAFT_02732484 [Schizophyllum commune H4-8]